MKTPQVGDIVRFVNDAHSSRAQAAIVTAVHAEHCINVHVFSDGTSETRHLAGDHASIDRDDMADPNATHQWHWPEA